MSEHIAREDWDFNAMDPAILERLRTIVLAFRAGALDDQAAILIDELRTFSDVLRVTESDTPEAQWMLWCLRGFSVPIGDHRSLVFTPEEEGIPSVEYLRRGTDGIWRLWYYDDDPKGVD